MKIKVDYDLCEANAICMQQAPEVFKVDEEDNLHILDESPGEGRERGAALPTSGPVARGLLSGPRLSSRLGARRPSTARAAGTSGASPWPCAGARFGTRPTSDT